GLKTPFSELTSLFVLSFFERKKTGGRAECLSIVVDRQVPYVQRHDAPRSLVFDDNGHRAPLHSLAERNATAAGETGVREAFQHDVRIILQQGLDLPLELFLGGEAGVLLP